MAKNSETLNAITCLILILSISRTIVTGSKIWDFFDFALSFKWNVYININKYAKKIGQSDLNMNNDRNITAQLPTVIGKTFFSKSIHKSIGLVWSSWKLTSLWRIEKW